MAGYSGKPVVQKLGIQPGFCIFIEGAPAAYGDIVGQLPAGVTIAPRLKAPLDMVHLFATEAVGLAAKLRRCRAAIGPDGMIWVYGRRSPPALPPTSRMSSCAIRHFRLASSISRSVPSMTPGPD
jgi:hypothetical protein